MHREIPRGTVERQHWSERVASTLGSVCKEGWHLGVLLPHSEAEGGGAVAARRATSQERREPRHSSEPAVCPRSIRSLSQPRPHLAVLNAGRSWGWGATRMGGMQSRPCTASNLVDAIHVPETATRKRGGAVEWLRNGMSQKYTVHF